MPPKPTSPFFFKNSRQRLISGVCAGIANYTKTNVDHVRFLFILLTFIAGLGLALYTLLWLLLPQR